MPPGVPAPATSAFRLDPAETPIPNPSCSFQKIQRFLFSSFSSLYLDLFPAFAWKTPELATSCICLAFFPHCVPFDLLSFVMISTQTGKQIPPPSGSLATGDSVSAPASSPCAFP